MSKVLNATGCEPLEPKLQKLNGDLAARMNRARNEVLARLAARSSAASMLLGDAIYVELRELRRNTVVLANFRQQLPADRWTLHFWHGPHNHHRVRESAELATAISNGQLVLKPMLSLSGMSVDPRSFTYSNYTHMLTSPWFWNSFSREQLLVLEPDTVLCPNPAVPLHAFSEYAFVGAPWAQPKGLRWAEGLKERGFPAWCFNLGSCVGNCGLSLWRRDVVAGVLNARSTEELKLLVLDYLEAKNCVGKKGCLRKRGTFWGPVPQTSSRLSLRGRINGTVRSQPPDAWFSRVLQALWHQRELSIRPVPPEDVAALFSVETHYTGSYAPIAAHKPHAHLSPRRLRELLGHCPPLRTLLKTTAEDAGADVRAFFSSKVNGAMVDCPMAINGSSG